MNDINGRKLLVETVLPHLDDAFTLARWLTGNATDAEDVVQEACLRALKGAGGFAGGSPRAWLMAIVRNAALTWLGRNRPRALVLTDDLEAAERAAPAHSDVATPEAEAIAQADATLLEAAIADLPTLYREAIVMREFNDMSYRDMAVALDVPIGTIMSRLARARALLVQRIGKEMS
jgi:RNA polymerase sigma factor (sigma-70 family)